METTHTIWTVGHSNHDKASFAALVKRHGIECVVDVRTSPYSRFNPQYNRTQLEVWLPEKGISYNPFYHLSLGGKGEIDPEARKSSVREVAELAKRRKVAVMCSEGTHKDCHRWSTLTPLFEELGVKVIHIERDGSLIENHEHAIPKSKPQMAMDELLSSTA